MKLKMENLAEQIAAELGKKWVQLYSRLGLGARDRYRFITEHKDEPSPAKEMKCGRDTIRLWLKGVSDLPEREAMTQLLTAFGKVAGFREKAEQLANSFGVTLDQLHSVTDTLSPSPLASTSSSSDSLASGTSRTFVPSTPYGDSMSTETHSTPHTVTQHTPHTVTQSTPHTVTQSTPHTVTQSTPHTVTQHTPHTVTQHTPHTVTQSTPHSGMVVSDSEGGSDLEMSNSSSSSLPQSTNVQETNSSQPTNQSAHSLAMKPSSLKSQDDLHLLNSSIDISLTNHKYVLLDVCQRLPARSLSRIAQRLCLSQEKIREITLCYSMVEERYYQVLKCWLDSSTGDDRATFAELQSALESCQQQSVYDVMLRRLKSTGTTLS